MVAPMIFLAVIEGIGAIGALGGLGLEFFDFFSAKDESSTGVRIGLGSLRESANAGGNVPGVALYDVWGKRIGHENGSKKIIQNGSPEDIVVEHYDGVGKPQSEYVAISNGGDDAICIAYVTVTWPDNVKQAFLGDIGMKCGSDWYHSETKLGQDLHKPKCIWIDRNGSNGLRHQGFAMHITDFHSTEGRAAQYEEDEDTMCNSRPRFHNYKKMVTEDDIFVFDPPLDYNPGTLTDKDRKKVLVGGKLAGEGRKPEGEKRDLGGSELARLNRRAVQQADSHQLKLRADFMNDVLIMSESTQHSATELCLSGTSVGPDFVSLKEGLFCDMSEKEIWPVCDEKTTHTCFDTATETMRGGGIGARDETSGRLIPSKKYSAHQLWGGEQN